MILHDVRKVHREERRDFNEFVSIKIHVLIELCGSRWEEADLKVNFGPQSNLLRGHIERR